MATECKSMNEMILCSRPVKHLFKMPEFSLNPTLQVSCGQFHSAEGTFGSDISAIAKEHSTGFCFPRTTEYRDQEQQKNELIEKKLIPNFSELQAGELNRNIPLSLQERIHKTKICIHNLSGRCTRSSRCSFAHSMQELKEPPDLYKTRLCITWATANTCLKGNSCRFAHGSGELRSTLEFYKTSLCPYWSVDGTCIAGESCRWAHGDQEIRCRSAAETPAVLQSQSTESLLEFHTKELSNSQLSPNQSTSVKTSIQEIPSNTIFSEKISMSPKHGGDISSCSIAPQYILRARGTASHSFASVASNLFPAAAGYLSFSPEAVPPPPPPPSFRDLEQQSVPRSTTPSVGLVDQQAIHLVQLERKRLKLLEEERRLELQRAQIVRERAHNEAMRNQLGIQNQEYPGLVRVSVHPLHTVQQEDITHRAQPRHLLRQNSHQLQPTLPMEVPKALTQVSLKPHNFEDPIVNPNETAAQTLRSMALFPQSHFSGSNVIEGPRTDIQSSSKLTSKPSGCDTHTDKSSALSLERERFLASTSLQSTCRLGMPLSECSAVFSGRSSFEPRASEIECNLEQGRNSVDVSGEDDIVTGPGFYVLPLEASQKKLAVRSSSIGLKGPVFSSLNENEYILNPRKSEGSGVLLERFYSTLSTSANSDSTQGSSIQTCGAMSGCSEMWSSSVNSMEDIHRQAAYSQSEGQLSMHEEERFRDQELFETVLSAEICLSSSAQEEPTSNFAPGSSCLLNNNVPLQDILKMLSMSGN